MIQIFTPVDSESLVKSSVEKYIKEYRLNDIDNVSVNGEYILHHAPRELDSKTKAHLIDALSRGAKVMPLVDFLDKKNGYTEIGLLTSDYFIQKTDFSVLRSRRKVQVKNIMDKIIAIFLLILTSPVILISSILIRLESRGPILFYQERIGKFNIPFDVVKFRSMRIDAEQNGAQWSQVGDVRITRIGHVIRKLRIDELPQLINVLKGEMSIIGPRPERPYFAEQLVKKYPSYLDRLSVKPGLTGWAQINQSYDISIEDVGQKLKYDFYYIENLNFIFDLQIMIKTILVVLLGKGW